jgi:hypothetical protein
MIPSIQSEHVGTHRITLARFFRDGAIRAVKRHPPKLRCRWLGALAQTSEQSAAVAQPLPLIGPPEATTAGRVPCRI